MYLRKDTILLGIFDYMIFPNGQFGVSGGQGSSCKLSSVFLLLLFCFQTMSVYYS